MKIKGFALLSLSLVLVGCTSPSSEVAFSVHETNREWYIEGKFEIIESWSNSRKKVSEVRDLETGVHKKVRQEAPGLIRGEEWRETLFKWS